MPDALHNAIVSLLGLLVAGLGACIAILARRIAAPREHHLRNKLLEADVSLRRLEVLKAEQSLKQPSKEAGGSTKP